MSKYAGLSASLSKPQPTSPPAEQVEPTVPTPANKRAKARQGKHGVMGYFSADLMKGMRMLAAEEDKTIQSLLGEAIDLLMRNRGKHPFGER